MNIDGENYTLVDLSRGKINEPYINDKFIDDFISYIPYFDNSEYLQQNQPDQSFYIENKNYLILNQSNIYNGGYIFSQLPYPYEVVYDNGEYKIEMVFPKIYDFDLSSPKISAPNPYIEEKEKKIKAKTQTQKLKNNEIIPKRNLGRRPLSKIPKPMR